MSYRIRHGRLVIAWVPLVFALIRASSATVDNYWDTQFGRVETQGESLHAIGRFAVHDGSVYGGGRFSILNGQRATNIAKWDGARWIPLPTGPGSREEHFVEALVSHRELLYAAGSFNRAGSVSVSNIAAWNGREWSDLAGGMNGPVTVLASYRGHLVAGGTFTEAGGVPALNIAQWDGRVWSALGRGISRTNYACADCEEGLEIGRVRSLSCDARHLFVGGNFHRAGEMAATNIARWNGIEWSALGNVLDGEVQQVAVVHDTVFAAGEFRTFGDVVWMAQWKDWAWSPVGTGVLGPYGVVQALASNGRALFVGGNFSRIGGVPASGLAVWDGTNWFPFGSGVSSGIDQGVTYLYAAPSALCVGGVFSRAGSTASTNAALWHVPQTLKVAPSVGQISISWPAADNEFVVETARSLDQTNWTLLEQEPVIVNDRLTVTDPIFDGSVFFRLRRK